jgi:hypothetical protein
MDNFPDDRQYVTGPYVGIRFYAGKDLPKAPVTQNRHRWYIELGFAGFNSAANNRNGYETEAAALAAIRRYQQK